MLLPAADCSLWGHFTRHGVTNSSLETRYKKGPDSSQISLICKHHEFMSNDWTWNLDPDSVLTVAKKNKFRLQNIVWKPKNNNTSVANGHSDCIYLSRD